MNKITFPLKSQMTGPQVRDLQDALQHLIAHGGFKDDGGTPLQQYAEALRGEQAKETYGLTTFKLVRRLQAERGLAVSGEVDEPTAGALNQLLGLETGELQFYQVEGRVFSAFSVSVGGLRVVIVDKGVGGDVQLAQTTTGEAGDYLATFFDGEVRARGKTRPDLQARVFVGDAFLGASEVRFNASGRETLNVVLEDKAASALRSEHEVLTGTLAGHVKGKLADLKETDEQQDITYLANKTGWDARAVALAALSDQFSARTAQSRGAAPIPQAFFYALFRAGLPANEDTLYHTDAKTLEAAWKKAVEQGVIPKTSADQIPAMVQRFRTASAQKLLSGPALVGSSSFKETLTVSRLNDTQQKQFAELYAAHRTDQRKLWDAVGTAFGAETAKRLQLDGTLGFLSINNAPLMQKMHAKAGQSGLSDPLQLAQAGFYRGESWGQLLTGDVPIPKEIPGDTPETKRANYANYLAAQVRLGYPTAAVAQMVKSKELPLTNAAAGTSDTVHAFLTEHQGKFEIGVQPVQQYIAKNNLQVADETVQQLKRLQRVYQITPSDQAMTGLMKRGVDAAYHVARYDKDTFVQDFATDLGGADQAALTYDKSVQVHNAVLNVVLGYLNARTAPMIGANGDQSVLDPTPTHTGDVIPYPTLEKLFGEMDYCACDHCRSILSPAAYLVDTLMFLDQPHPPSGTQNPQSVLLERRPDLQHLPLTCENTNTALPYIDVVNETLEYYIANNNQKLSLNDYHGHDTSGVASEDLLASPQFVMETAYQILRDERFPAPLPFHRPLESLRRYFDKFEVSLPLAMERLRKTDLPERGQDPYGWRDILMEELRLSRAEYEILTASTAVPLWRMYGFPNGTADAAVIAGLSNAKQFSRRIGITYEEMVSILKTRFVNPNSVLIPKVERLGVSFATLQAFKAGQISDVDFNKLLEAQAVPANRAEYGGDINVWVRNDANFKRIMTLIVLVDPSAEPDPCSFDKVELRYSKPMANSTDVSTRLVAADYIRLLRFIRLWKKLGWTIEQTDVAICALYRGDFGSLTAADVDTAAKLDAGFLGLLPRLGVVVRVLKALGLTVERDLLPLLACWSDVGTHGNTALYRQMFLNPALLRQDSVFADNGYGEFLADPHKLADHAPALRSAFNLSGDEYDRIVAALGYDANTPLTIPNASAIYRRGWLARKLKLSVRELLLLTQLTNFDPFGPFEGPDPFNRAILLLIAFVQTLKDSPLSTAAALYLIWNQDLSGKSAPDRAQVAAFARTLRAGLTAVEAEFMIADDPDGTLAQAHMAKVYGPEAAALFFGLLGDTLTVEVEFGDPEGTLAPGAVRQAIEEAAGKTEAGTSKITYDDFRKRLAYAGVLTAAMRDAIKAATGARAPAAFKTAVDELYTRHQATISPFFARYPELRSPFDAYVADRARSASEKRTTLLKAILPGLIERRKRQQALQAVSTVANTDQALAPALLDAPEALFPLHATDHADQPALRDLLAIQTPGLSVQFFTGDTATGAPVRGLAGIASNLDYRRAGNPLPANPTAGAAISGIWRGYVEAPETGFYNLRIEADAGAKVTLLLDGKPVALAQDRTLWSNAKPLQLQGGTLYAITLTVEKVRDILRVQWEWDPKGQGRGVIPARYLYPAPTFASLSDTYVRFLKAASLATGLGLTANELAFFATHADYRIGETGWLNHLAVSGSPGRVTGTLLLKTLGDLLDFVRIKAEISPGDESLLSVLTDPAAAAQIEESLLFALTRWNKAGLNAVLAHFSGGIPDHNLIEGLRGFALFRRVYDAFALIQTMGIPAQALIKATTNEPAGETVRDLQAALRARYDAADWRDVVRPINDEMRALQRDALVAYILHEMRAHPEESAHIDTPNKLFEYFLMDVEMEPCMQTSRIRHALSSVQLFIERCLMNLEKRVSPAAINAKHWEWMKRYRVWEANRKVYLYPENWLEPELRDDKSPFFKELESELLQSDITDERAATALLSYLSKLDEVAKLEICGTHYVPADPATDTGEVTHVVARTAGTNRKYFYRRREYGYWTPWEQIKLEIEDNPVIPVVWNDRLFVFWLRILNQKLATVQPPFSGGGYLTSLKTTDIKTDPPSRVRVSAVLCWSEYFNGKWQPTRTSDTSDPLYIGDLPPNDFVRYIIGLAASFPTDGTLIIALPFVLPSYMLEGFGIDTSSAGAFQLRNTHSLPENKNVSAPVQERTLETSGANTLKISYTYQPGYNAPYILKNPLRDRAVQPNHPVVGNPSPWHVPFFYEDARHVFYVTTTKTLQEVPLWGNFGIPEASSAPELALDIPQVSGGPIVNRPNRAGVIVRQPGLGENDLSPIDGFVTEDAYINRVIGTPGTVPYGNAEIGPTGSKTKSTPTE